MKKFFMMVSALLVAGMAMAAEVQTNGNNVTIRPDGGEAKVICLEVMNDNIIRVRATSKDALPEKPASLMIVPQTAPAKGSYSVSEEGDNVVVKAKNVKAVVAKATGEVTFFDANGNQLLKEAKDGIPYEEVVEYVPGDHTYGIIGSFAGSEWNQDGAAMEPAGDNVWTGEVELKANDEFKVRADGDWTYSWGAADGANLVAEADGTYIVTITFDGPDATVEVTAK